VGLIVFTCRSIAKFNINNMDNAMLQNLLMFHQGQPKQKDEGGYQDQSQIQQVGGIEGFPAGGLLHQYLQQQEQQNNMPSQNNLSNPLTNTGLNLPSGSMDSMGNSFPVGSMMGNSFNDGAGAGINFPTSMGYPSPNVSAAILTQANNGNSLMNNAQNYPSASQQKNDEWIGNATGQGDPYAENGILGPWSSFSAGLLGNMALSSQEKGKKIRKKCKDKPKRPLSGYNIFFKEERNRILEDIPDSDAKTPADSAGRKRKKRPHGKIGFESLAKLIGKRWRELTPEQNAVYKNKAAADTLRYKKEMEAYVANGSNKVQIDDQPAGTSEKGKMCASPAFFEPMRKRNKLNASVFDLEAKGL
jgi:hypothetical protein